MSKLIIEPSPHIKSGVTTQKIMLSVIIALLPALVASVWIFGLRALIMTVICCTSCVIFEWACRKIMKRSNTISDLSAVVTGMLLAFNLPVTLPFYMAIIGCFVAIVIVKQRNRSELCKPCNNRQNSAYAVVHVLYDDMGRAVLLP